MPKFSLYNYLETIFEQKNRLNKNNNNLKLGYKILIQQILIIFLLVYITIYKKKYFILSENKNNNFKNDEINNSNFIDNLNFNYEYNTFAIITCKKCKFCGLFAIFKYYLYDITEYINNGYIPIIDLSSFPNIFNGFNESSINQNPWENFFNQPFGYTLENVKKMAKKVKYFNCSFPHKKINHKTFYFHKFIIDFWHNILIKYIPIKKEIIKESNIITKILLKNSNNILGILIRGTDYLARKPKFHPIPPNITIVINDIKIFDKKYKYDYFFIGTEDNIIRNKFINEFGEKLKYIKSKNEIEYNYKKKSFLALNKNMKGNINNIKIYLLNIIILSKCIDVICARTNGTIGLLILTKGFRNSKIYFLGEYK